MVMYSKFYVVYFCLFLLSGRFEPCEDCLADFFAADQAPGLKVLVFAHSSKLQMISVSSNDNALE